MVQRTKVSTTNSGMKCTKIFVVANIFPILVKDSELRKNDGLRFAWWMHYSWNLSFLWKWPRSSCNFIQKQGRDWKSHGKVEWRLLDVTKWEVCTYIIKFTFLPCSNVKGFDRSSWDRKKTLPLFPGEESSLRASFPQMDIM